MKKNFILFSFLVKKHLLYKIKYIYLFELIHSFFNNNLDYDPEYANEGGF